MFMQELKAERTNCIHVHTIMESTFNYTLSMSTNQSKLVFSLKMRFIIVLIKGAPQSLRQVIIRPCKYTLQFVSEIGTREQLQQLPSLTSDSTIQSLVDTVPHSNNSTTHVPSMSPNSYLAQKGTATRLRLQFKQNMAALPFKCAHIHKHSS